MGTNTRAPPTTRRVLHGDLFETLARYRNAEHAHMMAEALIRKDSTAEQLVALVDDCQRAVFYNPNGRTMKAYSFDHHGIREADFDTLWRLLSDAASWVDAHESVCDWIHPDIRRALDGPENEDEWISRPG